MQFQDVFEFFSKNYSSVPFKRISAFSLGVSVSWRFWGVGWEGKLTRLGLFNRWLTHLVTVWHQLRWQRQRLLLAVWMALFALLIFAMAGALVFCGSGALFKTVLKQCLWQVFWSQATATLVVYLDCLESYERVLQIDQSICPNYHVNKDFCTKLIFEKINIGLILAL